MQQSRTTPSQHQGYLPLPAYTDSTPSLVSESPDDSFDSNSSETGAAVPPSAPNVCNLKQKRHSGRAWFLATSVSTVLAMMLLMQHVDGLAAIRQALASTPLVSSTAQCPDPYVQPGFLWRSTNRTMARWIPFGTASHLERDDSVDFRTVGGRFSVDDVPDQALALAPPSLSLAMLARKEARQRSADLEGVDALDFVRGKKVAIAGCSLDRNAMASMCKTLGLGESELTIDLHGYSSCHFRDLDFTVEIWFHGGVREHYRVDGKDYTFEEKMKSDYLPRVRASGRAPHYIILASGTWDQRSLSAIFQPTEDVSASKQHQAPKDKLVPLLPLQAYAYYQTRLRDMVRFLRAEFPHAGLMFRPETYQNKNTNAIVYNIREAAIAAMRSVQVPIFLWAEKLIGEQDMYDAIHYREGSAANWLWSDMLLHYLRHYSEGTNSCYLS